MAVKRAVFLDKDGTLIMNLPFNADPDLIRLLPGSAAGVRIVADAGYQLIVISNQPGVGMGLFKEEALTKVSMKLNALLGPEGVEIQGFYYCPHKFGDGCECRKPRCGLLEKAARERELSLADSWMIGDILDDVEAGKRAGCRSILIDNGNETEWRGGALRTPDYLARDLEDACRIILRADSV